MNVRKTVGLLIDLFLLITVALFINTILSLFLKEDIVNIIMMVICLSSFTFLFSYIIPNEKTIGKKISKLLIKNENKKISIFMVVITILIILVLDLIVQLIK